MSTVPSLNRQRNTHDLKTNTQQFKSSKVQNIQMTQISYIGNNQKDKSTELNANHNPLDALSTFLSLLQHNDRPIQNQNEPSEIQHNKKQKSLSNLNDNRAKSRFNEQLKRDKFQEEYIIINSHKTFSSAKKVKNYQNLKNEKSSSSKMVLFKDNLSSKLLNSDESLQVQKEGTQESGNENNKQRIGVKQGITDKNNTSHLSKKKQNIESQSYNSLYQQVLSKNFQVIDNLLRKINLIYSQHEEYDKVISQLSQKMHKLSIDNDNIHHEFRTSHFMIDKKLNSITNDYSNLFQDMALFKKNMFRDPIRMESSLPNFPKNFQALKNDQNQEKRINGKSLKKRTNKNNSKTNDIQTSNELTHEHSSINTQMKTSNHKNTPNLNYSVKSMLKDNQNTNLINLKNLHQQNLGKSLLQEINQFSCHSSSSLQQDDSRYSSENQHKEESSQSIIFSDNRQLSINKEKKSKKQSVKSSKKSSNQVDLQSVKNYISEEMSRISQLKKFTQLGIQTMMVKKCQDLEKNFNQKLNVLRRQILEQKLEKEFKKSLLQQIQKQTSQIISNNGTQMQKLFKGEISVVQQRLSEQISVKSDKQQVRQSLKQILDLMNKKFNSLMDECFQQFAQRNQTKRAILFLEKKINKIVQTAQIFTSDSNFNEDEKVKCLSCNKTFTNNKNSKTILQSQSQPLFTQVHLLSPSNEDSLNSQNQSTGMSNIKRNSPISHNKLRFTDTTNYNTVNQIFQNSQKKNEGIFMNMKSSQLKEQFLKKSKSNQTSQSLHVQSSANNKSKLFINSQENMSKNLNTMLCNDINQRNWKQKASSMLKKEGSGKNWRSKSHYKKS